MTNEEKEIVCQRIDQEGFDYCFMCYTDFKEIKDKKFHKLREAYKKANRELSEYLGIEEG